MLCLFSDYLIIVPFVAGVAELVGATRGHELVNLLLLFFVVGGLDLGRNFSNLLTVVYIITVYSTHRMIRILFEHSLELLSVLRHQASQQSHSLE